MVDKFCQYLVNKMKEQMPDIDEERAEIIYYGLQNIIGELPKFFILLLISYLFGIWQLTLISFFAILPYRAVSGGFHLHTHLGCILATSIMYCGTAVLGKYVLFEPHYLQYILTIGVWIFSIIMIHLYAPADTENVPILRKKDRKQKKILSYIILTITLGVSIVIPNQIIANILLFGTLIQTCTITRLAYKITKNQYGYEIYEAQQQSNS